MEPTLSGRDYVLCAPVDRFRYDSLYVVEIHGRPVVRRVQSYGVGKVLLLRDNPVYGITPTERADAVPLEWFNQNVLGIVVCDLRVRDATLMLKAWQGRL